jgi:hypothetical protein
MFYYIYNPFLALNKCNLYKKRVKKTFIFHNEPPTLTCSLPVIAHDSQLIYVGEDERNGAGASGGWRTRRWMLVRFPRHCCRPGASQRRHWAMPLRWRASAVGSNAKHMNVGYITFICNTSRHRATLQLPTLSISNPSDCSIFIEEDKSLARLCRVLCLIIKHFTRNLVFKK